MIKTLRLATVASLLVSLLGCAGGEGSKPRWSEAPEIDVAGYSTFGWSDRTGKPPVTILDNQIRNAVRAELVAKGYVESSDAPDFLVHHEPVEQETVKQGSPVRIGIGIGTRSGNVGGSVGTSVDVGEKDQVVQQMRVSIRATTPDEREAWIGTTAVMAERPDEETVDRAIAGVMKGFPDRRQ
ncbi:MAG: DUF4136 domain-containing protein [Pseudomonadales bacterium]